MDGTVAGDGAGPRTMIHRVDLILAAADSVAIDAIAARLVGDPLSIPFLRMAHERGLGIADPREIELPAMTCRRRISASKRGVHS